MVSCVPTESQHAKADTEDGSDHSHGTVDVLVCNRSSRLAQPSVIPLVWNLEKEKEKNVSCKKCDMLNTQYSDIWNIQF